MDTNNEIMKKAFQKAHRMVKNAEDIQIYSHIDCDGITAGAILSSMLDRLEKDHEVEFITLDKIDDLSIESELTIFSDLGSGQNVHKLGNSSSKIIILDHHPPLRPMIYDNHVAGEFLEIKSHYYGIDGSFEVSGGGMSYLLARTFGFNDLSWLGILSAVGDMQNNMSGKLVGLNKSILTESVQNKLVDPVHDLSFYGRQTRPVYVALSYFGDVKLPITNNRNESIHMMNKLGIPTKNGKKARVLSDLSKEEKGLIFSELLKMLSREVPKRYIKYVPKLISGESYEFLEEPKYTSLRDASEFSTAINACSRHKHPEIALNVLKGNRSHALDEMDHLALEHRRYLAQKMDWIREEERIVHLQNLQYFEGSEIKSELIGTVAGMILSYGDWRKPIIGFTPVNDDGDGIKVSLRCSRLLAYDGIHFGNIIRDIAEKSGGNGGGHSVACGAYIPDENINKFLRLLDEYLKGKI